MDVVCHVQTRLDWTRNEDKSRIADARQGSFDFLGFSFVQRQSHRTGTGCPQVEPSKQSMQRIKAETKRLTPVSLPEVISRLNRTLRGRMNYFHYRHCTAAPGTVRRPVEELRHRQTKGAETDGQELLYD